MSCNYFKKSFVAFVAFKGSDDFYCLFIYTTVLFLQWCLARYGEQVESSVSSSRGWMTTFFDSAKIRCMDIGFPKSRALVLGCAYNRFVPKPGLL